MSRYEPISAQIFVKFLPLMHVSVNMTCEIRFLQQRKNCQKQLQNILAVPNFHRTFILGHTL